MILRPTLMTNRESSRDEGGTTMVPRAGTHETQVPSESRRFSGSRGTGTHDV